MVELIHLNFLPTQISPYADKLGRSNLSNIDNRNILNDIQFESIIDNKYFLLSSLVNIYNETQKNRQTRSVAFRRNKK